MPKSSLGADDLYYLRLVKEEIENGRDVNLKYKFLNTYIFPLHLAILCNDLSTVKKFIKRGAKVQSVGHNACTGLHLAADENFVKIAKLLLHKGAEVNAKDVYGCTPLHVAASKGFLVMAKLLIAKEAQVNAVNDHNETALHAVAATWEKARSVAVAKLLLNNLADINALDKNNHTLLNVAALRGNFGVAKLLLARGADINVLDNDNCTPLNVAMRGGFFLVAGLLRTQRENLLSNTHTLLPVVDKPRPKVSKINSIYKNTGLRWCFSCIRPKKSLEVMPLTQTVLLTASSSSEV